MHSFEDAVPVYRADDNEHVGYIAEQDGAWFVLTMFGVPFAEVASEDEARRKVLNDGLQVLMGTWEYYDPETKEWQPCVIIEAAPDHVQVARMDGPTPDPHHSYLIKNPGERSIRKA